MKLKRALAYTAEHGISIFKWLLGAFMVFAGITTMFGELTPMDGALGFLYETRASLVFFGILFACSGLMLLYGKWRRSRKWTGRGLMFIYCEFLFATIINGIAYNWVPGYWVGNAVATAIVAALWLRWKFKTEYVNPRHFRDDMHHFRGDTSNVNRE